MVTIILGISIFNSIRLKEKGKKNFEIFYGSRLDGKIENIQVSVGVIYIKLINSDHRYSFIPITSTLNENTPFFNVAENGDHVFKPSNSDALKLIKDEKTYVYTFQKF